MTRGMIVRLGMAGLCSWAAIAPLTLAAANYGGEPVPYLRAGVGARAQGMGSAGTAASVDASGIYWNPGQLPFLENDSFASQTSILGLERSWNFLSYVHPARIANRGAYAYGLGWINFSGGGDIEARHANQPEPERMFGDSANTWMLSGSTSLGEGAGLGLNFKILTHMLDTDTATGIGADLGFWHRADADFSWGIMLQDVYSTLSWPSNRLQERLPAYARAGVAYGILHESLLATFETGAQWSWPTREITDLKFQLGAEYALAKTFCLRAGLDSGRWTAGAGWRFIMAKLFWVEVNYALAAEQIPGAGLTQFISLGVDLLPAEEKKE